MKIGLISYDCKHLKTEQVLQRILDKGFELKFYLLPFIERKNREILFNHRPDQNNSILARNLAKSHDIDIKYIQDPRGVGIDNRCDYYLILGAGLLDVKSIGLNKIINVHPGIIPISRGLDSFKWSIYNNEPLGVSMHYIDDNPDSGELISIIKTNVYRSDTLETLARRHYENEINLLSNFDFYLSNPRFDFVNMEKREARMRMPFNIELRMVKKFEEYKNRWAI
ncbi:formyltransferase family protein [Campylobacter sp. MOP51]|uniref:formyltransferase family protein n=1 Tax=Campylobacter canis TaxID=3378588 RepID=UPI003C66A8C9